MKRLQYIDPDKVLPGDKVIEDDRAFNKLWEGVVIEVSKEGNLLRCYVNFFEKAACWHSAYFLYKIA